MSDTSTTTKGQELTLAVLPFQYLSADPDIAFYAQGFAEDLIVHLARYRVLNLISAHSSRLLNMENLNDEKLQLDYWIKGSFRMLGKQLRIGIQLIRAHDNQLVFAERYHESLDSLFSLQDDITEQIVSHLQESLNLSLLQQARQKNITQLAAYDCWLRGMEQLKKGTPQSDEAARAYFHQALAVDPNYPRAYTGLSLSYFNEWSCQLWDRWEVSQKGALQYALQAVALDENDYVSLTVLGRIYLYQAEYEKAEHLLRKSLRINPSDTDNLVHIAAGLGFLGYPEEAEKLFLKAKRLNPLNEDWGHAVGCFIYFELEQYEKSIAWGLKANFEKTWVDLPSFLAAAYFHLGELEKMQSYWHQFEQQYQDRIKQGAAIMPQEALQWTVNVNPYKNTSPLIPFFQHIGSQTLKLPNEKPGDLSQALPPSIFRKGAGLWEMAYAGKRIFLADLKGFHDLHKLISSAAQEIHCLELMQAAVVEQADVYSLDEQAKQQYRAKLVSLQEDIKEAESFQDYEKASSLQKEYEQILTHLSSALGLGQKARKQNTQVEKARSATTWRIRSAIKKIKAEHPKLAKHLENAVSTGVFCMYSPEQQLDWEL